jgi:hypothetical protein
VNVVAFLPTGEMLAGDEAGNTTIWDVATGTLQSRYSTRDSSLDLQLVEEEDQITLQSAKAPEVTALAVSFDGRRVAVGNLRGGVQLWAVETDD